MAPGPEIGQAAGGPRRGRLSGRGASLGAQGRVGGGSGVVGEDELRVADSVGDVVGIEGGGGTDDDVDVHQGRGCVGAASREDGANLLHVS